MLNISNQNGVTYDQDYSYRLTDMNGESEKIRIYDINNMNGMTWDDGIYLSITKMNPRKTGT